WRRRESSRRLSAGCAGDPPALLHGASPAPLGGGDPAVRSGHPAARFGLGRVAALAHRPAVLSGRHQPPFPPPGPPRSEPDAGGPGHLGRRGSRGPARLPALTPAASGFGLRRITLRLCCWPRWLRRTAPAPPRAAAPRPAGFPSV